MRRAILIDPDHRRADRYDNTLGVEDEVGHRDQQLVLATRDRLRLGARCRRPRITDIPVVVDPDAQQRHGHIQAVGRAHEQLIVVEFKRARHQLIAAQHHERAEQQRDQANRGVGQRRAIVGLAQLLGDSRRGRFEERADHDREHLQHIENDGDSLNPAMGIIALADGHDHTLGQR